MKLFFKYIIQYRKIVVFLLLFMIIFLIVFSIYNTHTEAVLYSFLICTIIGIIAVIADFLGYRKKYTLLRQIYENLPLMTEELPASENLIEENLIEIIQKLYEINRQNLGEINAVHRDNSDYFTVWVHQIKTPISAMQMMLQSEDNNISRELSAELFRIEQYAEMALQYIRLDSNTNDYIIKQYEIDIIIRQAIRRYAPLFIRKKIQIDYSPASGKVLTDKKWLRFIVEQLLSNAVKYTIKGRVSIKFTDNVLYVSDTGIGISQEDLPRIFEKGYTGMSGHRDKKSTGLGLYLCKRVCDKLGHKISVESEIGKGTMFLVDLTTESFDIE